MATDGLRGGGDVRRQAHPQRRGGHDRPLWQLYGTLKNTFGLHDGVVNAVVLPDNQHALSGTFDHVHVKLFNVNDGAVLRTFLHQAY